MCIVNWAVVRNVYFQQLYDAASRVGLSLLQKCTTAVRQLAYDVTTNKYDERLHVVATTGV